MGEGEAILEVRGLVKTFGSLRAVDGVTMSIPRGKVTLLIGPNGSGKTTLVNLITGVIAPDRGRIIFEGADITRMPPYERFKLGIVRNFQIPRLFQGLSVAENTIFSRHGNPGEGVVSGVIRRLWKGFELDTVKRAYERLDLLKLRHLTGSRPRELSGGQMKLLEVARSVMQDRPKLVLMDEPTAGINPVLAHDIFRYIRSLSDNHGITFLVIEHRLDIAVDYVDYAYAMHLGKIIAEGDPGSVLSDRRVIESYLGG